MGIFFDTNGEALGLVVSGGVKYHGIHRGGSTLTGVILAFKDKVAIVPRDAITDGHGLEALQSGPRLVANGEVVRGIRKQEEFTRRSGVCTTKGGDIVLFAVTSALRGASLNEIAELLVNPFIQCQDALNLDGGGSSQFYISPRLQGASPDFQGMELTGRDSIPVALCLAPNTP